MEVPIFSFSIILTRKHQPYYEATTGKMNLREIRNFDEILQILEMIARRITSIHLDKVKGKQVDIWIISYLFARSRSSEERLEQYRSIE